MPEKPEKSVWIYLAIVSIFFVLLLQAVLISCTDGDSLRAVKRSGTIRVLTRNNANCYYTYRGKKTGFEYELAEKFATYLGVELEIMTPAWEDLIDDVNSGSGDFIAASMTITDSRQERVDFSDPYMNVQQQVIVHKDNTAIRTVDDLNNRVVHVRKGTSYEQRLNELRKNGLAIDIRTYDDVPTEEFIRRVAEKDIDVTVADSNIAMINRRYYPEIRMAFPLQEPEALGWAVAKGRKDLLAAINSFFRKIEDDGTYAKIYEKYYANAEIFDYVDLKKYHQRLKSRLPKFAPIIRKAAEENGFDWRLIAAMVYQESHFRPAARSYTGVRGLMQLTLTTAQELGIDNRLDPAQSIEGGVEYLKTLYDRYSEAPPADRLRIALASYNVGAGHVADAMEIAEDKGLEPHSWHALKRILPLLRYSKYYKKTRYGYCRGTEPVRYVERIMTYYDILKREAIT